jgi:hypothetical protein
MLDQARDAIREYRNKYGVAEHDRRLLGPEPPPGAFTQRHERNQTYDQVAGVLDQLIDHDPDPARPSDVIRDVDRQALSRDQSPSRKRSDETGFEP